MEAREKEEENHFLGGGRIWFCLCNRDHFCENTCFFKRRKFLRKNICIFFLLCSFIELLQKASLTSDPAENSQQAVTCSLTVASRGCARVSTEHSGFIKGCWWHIALALCFPRVFMGWQTKAEFKSMPGGAETPERIFLLLQYSRKLESSQFLP